MFDWERTLLMSCRGVLIVGVFLASSATAAEPPRQIKPVPIRSTSDPPRTDLLDRYGDPLPSLAVARLGTIRLRHIDAINRVAFSPDGKILASAGDDKVVLLWDVITGKQVQTMSHPNPVRAVLFTPDGKTLVSASNQIDGTRVHVWDVRSGKQIDFLAMPKPNGLAQMVLSNDGKVLVTSTVMGPVVAWDFAAKRELWRTEEERDWCNCLALAPDGKTLATGSDRGTVCLRDLRTGKAVHGLQSAPEERSFQQILSVAFSPDGEALSVTDERGTLTYWDVVTRKCTKQISIHCSILAPLAFSPDGKTLACGNEKSLQLYDRTGKELERIEAHQSWIRSVTFSPDGRYLASAGNDQTIRIWNLATRKTLHAFQNNPGGPCSVSFHREGSTLITSNWCSGFGHDHSCSTEGAPTFTRQSWDARSAATFRETNPGPCVNGEGCLSPDGKIFAGKDKEGLVALIDVASGKTLRTVGKKGSGFKAKPAGFSPDGGLVAVESNELGNVMTHGWERLDRLRLWDVATGKMVAAAIEEKRLNHVGRVRFSAKGRLLAAEEGPGLKVPATRLWHVAKDNSLRVAVPRLNGECDPVFSRDGRLLITIRDEKVDDNDGYHFKQAITVHHILSEKVVVCLAVQSGVCSYALSTDNQILALGDEAGTVRLVEVLSGKEVRRLKGHRGTVNSLEFSPEGTHLISGSTDTTALVWEFRPSAARDHRGERLSDTLWEDLASEDAYKAFEAVQTLSANPEKAIVLLQHRLRPIPQLEPEAIERLIADLDSKQFQVRERATERLRSLEQAAIPILKKAQESSSPEVRRRLEQLLIDAEDPRRSPERMREMRAIRCLKSLDNEPARLLLQTVAKGAPEARLTQEARELLKDAK